ncbi:head GIN domain-containing protein [Alterisphingorhabdus coralli]|uniref:Head GIN domain-containing protein n=1 Tax=Alterisphingorhabdus coralli TaxID=3071408 RepID=A0AA97F856_9SPHN|nr:head GIN domain-containing protein [Parasphingorhabdus sp. SCSIO 66989]WOE75246.1 head GIN domain-containing protein [Parasphingorhabdus sp. SCSIO 66989]
MRNVPFTLFKAAMVAGTAIGLSACSLTIGDDDDAAAPTGGETVTGEAFDSIALSGPDDVIVSAGETASWTVEGDAETLEKLRIRVDGGELKIRRSNNVMQWGKGDGKAIIKVTMPVLKRFSLAGSGDGEVAEMVGDSGEIDLAGSGAISVAKVALERLEVDLAGSGDVVLAGEAQQLEVSMAGSGDVEAAKLKADTVEVSVAGSGDVEIASDGEVDASIAGSGSITVSGKAKCTSDSVGSGKLTCG